MKSIFVTQPSMPSFEEYSDEIKSIWETRWLTNMGAKHNEFKEKLQDYLDVENIELFVNGHMALEMAIQAIGLKEGEVITTPFTFASTIHAIVRSGLKPVFCDINGEDYTIDSNKIESLITDKTCAILPVHVYGNFCDVKKIDSIAQAYKLKVIYDAAHAFGESIDGKTVGQFGDASIFSFHATKVFNTVEGGAVCYKNESVGRNLYELKNFGISGPESVVGIGANAKMNEFCASMGLCNLRHIKEEINKRRLIDKRYRENLEKIAGIKVCSINPEETRNYAYFPILICKEHGESRDALYERLKKSGIYARKYFYPIASEYECYENMYSSSETPIALDISKRVLTLPIYADLSIEDVDFICDIIKNR